MSDSNAKLLIYSKTRVIQMTKQYCCNDCYFFKIVNIGGKSYNWCFNTNHDGFIRDVKVARYCKEFSEFKNITDLAPDFMSRNQKEQRNKKIKRKCQVFRYHYSINNKVASIISRYSHWLIILSNNKEYLFHQNIDKNHEYEYMYTYVQPDFHIHKVVDNTPMAIQILFEEIESHDIYVLKHRYQASIREKVDNEIEKYNNEKK